MKIHSKGEQENQSVFSDSKRDKGCFMCKARVRLYCSTAVNFDLLLLELLLFAISSCHFFVYCERTAYLRVFGRPFIFLHAVVAILAVLPILRYHISTALNLWGVDNIISNGSEDGNQNETADTSATNTTGKDRGYSRQLSRSEVRANFLRKISNDWLSLFWKTNAVNGKLYLYKMFICKFIELGYQIYSYVQIYRCTFRTSLTMVFLIFIVIDCVINAKTVLYMENVVTRDRLLMWHLYVDFVCLGLPNFAMYYMLQIPLDVETSLILTVPTSTFIIMRSAEIMENFLRIDSSRIQVHGIRLRSMRLTHHSEQYSAALTSGDTEGKNEDISIKLGGKNRSENQSIMPTCRVFGDGIVNFKIRRRFSVFRKSVNNRMYRLEQEQFENFQWRTRVIFASIFGFIGAILLLVAVVQAQAVKVKYQRQCFREYDDGSDINLYSYCKEPVDYCRNLWKPSCDCSVLIANDYKNSSMPKTLAKMASLKVLKMVNGGLETLPENFGEENSNLAILHVENHKISRIPSSACQLSKLLYLYTPQNKLEFLPECLGELKKLVRLVAFSNQIAAIPKSIGSMGQNLLHVLLSRNRLSRLPSSLGNLKFLIDCDLSQNQLVELPSEMMELNSLLHLVLYDNKLESFFSDVSLNRKLRNLRTLLLQNNKLKNALYKVGDLTLLEVLDISSNKFETSRMPFSISKLQNLKELSVDNCNFSQLPLDIAQMKKMQIISYRNNKVASLPNSISKLNNLKALYLTGNPICEEVHGGKALPHEYQVMQRNNIIGLCEEQCSPGCLNLYVGDNICDDVRVFPVFRVLDTGFKHDLSTSIYPSATNYTGTGYSDCNVPACKFDGGDCKI